MLSFDRLPFGGAPVTAHVGVYPPQDDSRLLIAAMRRCVEVFGGSVLDLCTGSGVVAIAAARLGARSVTAFDICPDAVRCAQSNATAAGLEVQVRCGDHTVAAASGPYDVVVCNPPYLPTVPGSDALPDHIGPAWAWDAGPDGRQVLDPLCESAAELLRPGGVMLIVQSEFADPQESIRQLSRGGLRAYTVAAQSIPFGPVLSARAQRLQKSGAIPAGKAVEQLVVIRADKP